MQAQNWHDAGRKTGHGGLDLARGPLVWHPLLTVCGSLPQKFRDPWSK